MDDTTHYIDLTTDFTRSTDKGIKSPVKSRQEKLIIHHKPRHCNNQSNNNHKADPPAPTIPRMAVSIDSANFIKWRASEMSGKTSVYLPKLHRRRGRRSSWDKLPTSLPRKITISPPEKPPENKSKAQLSSEKEIPVVSVIKKPETNSLVSEKPTVNSAGFLGFGYLAWLVMLGLVTFLLVGSYITLF